MSEADSEPRKDLMPEELFAQALPLLNGTVRLACRRCHHHPTLEDVERLSQRLVVLLMENDYHVLRSYKQRAEFQTWLQTVANHHVNDFLRRERRKVCLYDMPPDFFTAQPLQENEIWENEKVKLLGKVVKRLTKQEQQLFASLLAEMTIVEIVHEKDVQVESGYQAKSRLIKKLQRLISELGGKR